MTIQRHLYDDSTATIRSGRPGLFDACSVVAGLTCEECGEHLIETDEYLCCPNGHGKLHLDPERCGKWFDDTGGE